MMDEEILTIREVADLLKLHPKTVNKLANSGKVAGLQDWSAVAVSEIGSPKTLREAKIPKRSTLADLTMWRENPIDYPTLI